MKYFLDTNICIFFLKGTFSSIRNQILGKVPSQIKIPTIVKAELLLGAYKSQKIEENLNRVLSFLDNFEIVPFDDPSSYCYAKIRATLESNGKVIGPNDLIIASIAQFHDGILVTNNVNEFCRIEELKVEDWTKQF